MWSGRLRFYLSAPTSTCIVVSLASTYVLPESDNWGYFTRVKGQLVQGQRVVRSWTRDGGLSEPVPRAHPPTIPPEALLDTVHAPLCPAQDPLRMDHDSSCTILDFQVRRFRSPDPSSYCPNSVHWRWMGSV